MIETKCPQVEVMGWEQWILSERAGKAEMLALGLCEVCIWQVEQGLPEKRGWDRVWRSQGPDH